MYISSVRGVSSSCSYVALTVLFYHGGCFIEYLLKLHDGARVFPVHAVRYYESVYVHVQYVHVHNYTYHIYIHKYMYMDIHLYSTLAYIRVRRKERQPRQTVHVK